MGIIAVVLIFTVDTKLAQAKNIWDELGLKHINNELDHTNVKRYLSAYVSKLLDIRLDPLFSFSLAIFYLLSYFIVMFSFLILMILSGYCESIFIFILLFIVMSVFLILIFQILNAPHSKIFRKWELNYLIGQPQYFFLYNYIGFLDIEDLEKMELKEPKKYNRD